MDKVNLNVNNIGEKTFSSWEACSFKPLQQVYNRSSWIWSHKQCSSHRGACQQLPAVSQAVQVKVLFFLSVYLFFGPEADRVLCCVFTSCQSSGRDIWCQGTVGVVSAGAQAGQTSPRGPSREMNERNANAVKYQVCFYRSMYAFVSVGVWQKCAVVTDVQVRCEVGVEDRHDCTSVSHTVF